jgi:sterol 3beta-glucosyltransferase
MPVLHGVSRHVVPEPPDWPEGAVSTGFWFLKRSDEWEAPPDLERFLNSGPAPVYLGFGSMTGRDPYKRTRIVLEALARTGQRGVLTTGWGGLARADVPKQVCVLEQVPHDWLFPLVAAVVHHGGAGTTAEGLRAGRPTVICPYFGDQPFWGQRVHELGVGPAPIPQKRLTAERLAAAIHEAITNVGMRQRAEALGEKIRSEDGAKSAVAFIETMLH